MYGSRVDCECLYASKNVKRFKLLTEKPSAFDRYGWQHAASISLFYMLHFEWSSSFNTAGINCVECTFIDRLRLFGMIPSTEETIATNSFDKLFDVGKKFMTLSKSTFKQ